MPSVRFRLNGAPTEVDADPDRPLLDILRGELGIVGLHFGCGAGECGACHVIVGDRAVTSCDMPLWSVADKDVTTLEGLGSADRPHPLQRAFIAEQAAQCGYCIAGMMMRAHALLQKNPFADRPPVYVRAQFYDYTFTDSAGKATGRWWERRLRGPYFPTVQLNSDAGSSR